MRIQRCDHAKYARDIDASGRTKTSEFLRKMHARAAIRGPTDPERQGAPERACLFRFDRAHLSEAEAWMIARRTSALMNGTKAKLGLLAALLSIAGAGEAKALDPDQLRTLPESDGPLQVQIGFHVFDITDISEKDETIDFNGAVYMQWNDPRQAYDPADFGYSAEDFPSGATSRSPSRL